MLRRCPVAFAPRMMRAVKITAYGGPEKLAVTNIQRPVLETGEVLVKVAATSINRGDIAQRKGLYPPPLGVTDTPGMEFSGTVVDMEASLEDAPGYVPEIGSRVMGIVAGGGYAEYVAVPASLCIPVPSAISLTQAAAIPETYLTAFQAMHHHAGLLPDKAGAAQYGAGLKTRPPAAALGRRYRMLVHAGASGVGIAACQIAKLFEITSITTSSEAKVEACQQWATYAVSRTPNESGDVFAEKVEAAVGKSGVDLIIDPVFGGRYLQEDGQLLAMDGTVVVLSFLGGSKTELDGPTFFQRRATIRFSALRNQSDFYKTSLTQAFRARIMPYIQSGKIKPVVAKTVSLDQIQDAHRMVEANELTGKCVVVVDPKLAEK
uniref:Enoyl reductase (ER) domain-containing protein n=1 Tax=Neobodo designis TaxID=312471 RepID=A0A7S1PPT9_NEODS|mmetsp:Transcript_15056/g.46670  ORF Transcript_15056/g.46670 Transcript_15056/m.46670 type:complete len:377 (+) Transcript_15056:151-1281(+)